MRFRVAVDSLVFPAQRDGEGPPVRASLVARDGTEHFVRLWPAADPGVFEGDVVAPHAGPYDARASAAGSTAGYSGHRCGRRSPSSPLDDEALKMMLRHPAVSSWMRRIPHRFGSSERPQSPTTRRARSTPCAPDGESAVCRGAVRRVDVAAPPRRTVIDAYIATCGMSGGCRRIPSKVTHGTSASWERLRKNVEARWKR